MKKVLIIIASVIVGLALLVLLFFGFLTITEYYPKTTEPAITAKPETASSSVTDFRTGKELSMISWNIGYAALGKDEDFFMDGGKQIQPDSKDKVQKYLVGITDTLKKNPADIYFIQEIDEKAQRSFKINELTVLSNALKMNYSFTYNYKCIFVPIPFPPIGQVASGVAIYTNTEQKDPVREPLPVPFSWPVRTANLKRCMLISRLPLSNSDKELVLVNFHLEAFDEGEGKIAQTKALMDFVKGEYDKGNYVIAGGDWNQTFPSTGTSKYPVVWPDGWQPGSIDASSIPACWTIACDDSAPTCRSVEFPYNDEKAANHDWQYYVIDGFLLSPNVEKNSVKVMDYNFENADHNPVKLSFTLK
ncbi:MAG: endonuclease/exonuclease/phosphatase family protein [Treponemataceae bacterium]|nr:endonuclease/exonuclease/phosphatase family protein [Treponemataceae bacterium]